MHYRRLGRTGYEISDIAHGLWGMSGWTGSNDEESIRALQLAVDLGCNFFDTAWAYGEGKSDGLLGQLIAANKGKRLYVASKVPPKNLKWPASSKDGYHDVFPTAHVLKYADLIRTKLGANKIDLLQFHVWSDHWADDPEFRATVETLKSEGYIGHFGLSLNRWQPENGLRALRTGLVDTVQVVYNVFDQSPEDRLFPLCQELNVGVIARVPLDEGSLAGNLTLETVFPEGDFRARYFNPEHLAATVERVDKLTTLLPHSMTLPDLALRYILSHPAVSTTIVGMRKPDHVRRNLALSEAGPLDAALVQQLKHHRWERTTSAR